jgi:hypothetical protein
MGHTAMELFSYLTANPSYILGFVEGEWCFTGYMGIDITNKWGIQPCFEFIITQNTGDIALLQSFADYFNCGKVYHNNNNVSMFTVRNLTHLIQIIMPFFTLHSLLGTKFLEFTTWSKLIHIMHSKSHIGDGLENRDALVEMSRQMLLLNAKRVNPYKELRLKLIIDWLLSLDKVPALSEKLTFKANLEMSLKGIRKSAKVNFTHYP